MYVVYQLELMFNYLLTARNIPLEGRAGGGTIWGVFSYKYVVYDSRHTAIQFLLLSVSELRRISLKCGSFGRKQLKAYMNRKPLPVIVQINVGDSDHIRTIKHIILDMTSFDASKRPSSADIRRQIVRPEVVPPKTSTTLQNEMSQNFQNEISASNVICQDDVRHRLDRPETKKVVRVKYEIDSCGGAEQARLKTMHQCTAWLVRRNFVGLAATIKAAPELAMASPSLYLYRNFLCWAWHFKAKAVVDFK